MALCSDGSRWNPSVGSGTRRGDVPAFRVVQIRRPRRYVHADRHRPRRPRRRHALGFYAAGTRRRPVLCGLRVYHAALVIGISAGCYGGIFAAATPCPLRGYGRAGTQNDRLSEAVILSTGTPIPAQWTCRRRCRYRADIEPGRPGAAASRTCALGTGIGTSSVQVERDHPVLIVMA